MDKRIKEGKKAVYIFTTSDGCKHSDSDRNKAKNSAIKHQKKLDIRESKETIERELWKAFGFPIKHYKKDFYPWDPDDSVDAFEETCNNVVRLFQAFGDSIGLRDIDTFTQFVEDGIFKIFIDHSDECKTIMDIIARHTPGQVTETE